jgi:hypothetical protein
MLHNSSSLLRHNEVQLARWLVAAGVTGVLLTACGSSSSGSSSTATSAATGTATPAGRVTHLLDTKRVARAIEASISSERQLKSKVTCPKAVPQEKGRTFTCVAETKMHKQNVKTVFTVHQKNGSGKVDYASPK